jgi:hypothetical protein
MVYLPPVLWRECADAFGVNDLDHRLLCGGLPETLLSEDKDAFFYTEWMDSFYARDIQELFSIRSETFAKPGENRPCETFAQPGKSCCLIKCHDDNIMVIGHIVCRELSRGTQFLSKWELCKGDLCKTR